jgi:hypothetical protein
MTARRVSDLSLSEFDASHKQKRWNDEHRA